MKTPIVALLIGISSLTLVAQVHTGKNVAPVATIRSSGGLYINGIPTPAGVTSVNVSNGDVIDTVGVSAIATLKDGRTVALAANTKYSVNNRSGAASSVQPTNTASRPSSVFSPVGRNKYTGVTQALTLSNHK